MMKLENDRELANTERKLGQLERQIEIARRRPATNANVKSLRSLVEIAEQLRAEIGDYRARQTHDS